MKFDAFISDRQDGTCFVRLQGHDAGAVIRYNQLTKYVKSHGINAVYVHTEPGEKTDKRIWTYLEKSGAEIRW